MQIVMLSTHRGGAEPSHATVKLAKAARDFEAILLGPFLESLEKAFSSFGQDSSASSDYRFMGTQALASSLAAGGGIGIASFILRSLETNGSTAEGVNRGVTKGAQVFSHSADLNARYDAAGVHNCLACDRQD